jgi:hypothetical protein
MRASWYLSDRLVEMPKLITREFFFGKSHSAACYTLAGSFTGFLLRRYEWKKYQHLYQTSYANNFEVNFAKCCGISLWKKLNHSGVKKWL